MLPRCGRAAHICGANKTVWELQQTSKRELEESQLPSKQKVEMMEQGFMGNCDSQASWGCAPALPNRIWVVSLRVIHAVFHMEHDTNKKASPCRLQATSRRQLKVFRCSSFSKMLPRCGRAAHICEANKTVWELQQTSKRELEESQLPSKQKAKMMEQGFRGNCDSQASWGCAPALPNRIQLVSLRVIHAVFHMKHHTKSFT